MKRSYTKRKSKDNKFIGLKKNSIKDPVKKREKIKVKKVISTVTSPPPVKPASIEKIYFPKETEDAIIAYNTEEDSYKRDIIYNNKIKKPFEKLVENIFNTFKFSYFETGPLDVQKETISHLVSNIHKYEREKGKAFSYFSIIAKHYLIFLNNKNYDRFQKSVEISDEREENTIQLQTQDTSQKNRELNEFMKLMLEFWDKNISKIFIKSRDLNIANAILELFRSSDRIEAFNKKALYLYIREISSCKTQQITKVINKMKQYQTSIYRSYINTGLVNTDVLVKF